LQAKLAERGWQSSPIDNWRDSGWVVHCIRETAKLDIVVAPMPDSAEWVLQISATDFPGIIRRLLGKLASAGPKEIHLAANDVHAILSHDPKFTDFKWRWDGFPDDANSTSRPHWT
jgi:hypothetical protein